MQSITYRDQYRAVENFPDDDWQWAESELTETGGHWASWRPGYFDGAFESEVWCCRGLGDEREMDQIALKKKANFHTTQDISMSAYLYNT